LTLAGGDEMKASIVIEKDEYGYYAFCPEMKGCHSQGDSLDDVLINMKEAIELYLETLSDEEKSACLSKEILTTSLEVNVA
jgi:predicted RNase H-like HicB family nuclease